MSEVLLQNLAMIGITDHMKILEILEFLIYCVYVGGFLYKFGNGSQWVGDNDGETIYGMQWHNITEKRLSWKRSWDYGCHCSVQLEI